MWTDRSRPRIKEVKTTFAVSFIRSHQVKMPGMYSSAGKVRRAVLIFCYHNRMIVWHLSENECVEIINSLLVSWLLQPPCSFPRTALWRPECDTADVPEYAAMLVPNDEYENRHRRTVKFADKRSTWTSLCLYCNFRSNFNFCFI